MRPAGEVFAVKERREALISAGDDVTAKATSDAASEKRITVRLPGRRIPGWGIVEVSPRPVTIDWFGIRLTTRKS